MPARGTRALSWPAGRSSCRGNNRLGGWGWHHISSATPVTVRLGHPAVSVDGVRRVPQMAGRGRARAGQLLGMNDGGVLGDGLRTPPRPVCPVEVHGITDATAVTAGYTHVAPCLAGGHIKCWGNNELGHSATPTPTTTSPGGRRAGGCDRCGRGERGCRRLQPCLRASDRRQGRVLGRQLSRPTRDGPRKDSWGGKGGCRSDRGGVRGCLRPHVRGASDDGQVACW